MKHEILAWIEDIDRSIDEIFEFKSASFRNFTKKQNCPARSKVQQICQKADKHSG